MPLNASLLDDHASFDVPEEGFAERFVRFRAGSGETVGVVTTPMGRPSRDLGWISCQSFGMEHIDMLGVERTVARRLAGAGYPVLRFHCQGYGDSEADPGSATLSTHVRDTRDAAAWAADNLGVSQLGLIGWKFGALVAARALDAVAPSHLVLASPPSTGARYMSELLRGFAFKDWGGSDESGANAGDLRARLEADGELDLGGLRLSREAFHEAGEATLSEVGGFRGRCLILQVSPSARPHRPLRELADRLNDAGGAASFVVLEHPYAGLLGRPRLRMGEFTQLADVLAGLDLTMTEEILSWLDQPERPSLPGPSEVAG
jgi:pimeloyl-ACP methyl ester carboxylesterase